MASVNEKLSKAYFACVEELKDAEGNSAGAMWQCKECPLGKGVLKRNKGVGGQHWQLMLENMMAGKIN